MPGKFSNSASVSLCNFPLFLRMYRASLFSSLLLSPSPRISLGTLLNLRTNSHMGKSVSGRYGFSNLIASSGFSCTPLKHIGSAARCEPSLLSNVMLLSTAECPSPVEPREELAGGCPLPLGAGCFQRMRLRGGMCACSSWEGLLAWRRSPQLAWVMRLVTAECSPPLFGSA